MKLDTHIRENEVRLKDSHHIEWKEQVAEQYVYYDLMFWLKNKNAISSIYSSIWLWNDSHHHVASHRSDLWRCSCPCLGVKEKEQAIYTHIVPKKTYRCPADTRQDVQRHYSPGECKSKPQWDTTSHLPEWLFQKDNKYWHGCREKGTLMCCWWEYKLVQPLWETVRRSLKEWKK